MSDLSPQFVTLEGVEGAGKTTQKRALCAFLDAHQIPYVETREPGGTLYAERIRELLLSHSAETVAPKTELLLMFAARAQHIEQLILPALDRGQWVICDRFTDATYAYQGGGRQLPVQWIAELESLVQGTLRPDTTLIFDVSVEVGLSRAGQRAALDRIESEAGDFFQRVRASYHAMAQEEPDRVLLINAEADEASVSHDMLTQLALRWGLPCSLG